MFDTGKLFHNWPRKLYNVRVHISKSNLLFTSIAAELPNYDNNHSLMTHTHRPCAQQQFAPVLTTTSHLPPHNHRVVVWQPWSQECWKTNWPSCRCGQRHFLTKHQPSTSKKKSTRAKTSQVLTAAIPARTAKCKSTTWCTLRAHSRHGNTVFLDSHAFLCFWLTEICNVNCLISVFCWKSRNS